MGSAAVDPIYFTVSVKMNYKVEVLRLSGDFYNAYPKEKYPELLQKLERPYACLLIEMRDYYVCIPYRTHVEHSNSYRFRNSVRSKFNKSGLDFSKIAIITNESYIGKSPALIDKDEYNETMINIDKIVSSVQKYIDVYILHIIGKSQLHNKEFERKYKYSTLPYFHKELGIQEVTK